VTESEEREPLVRAEAMVARLEASAVQFAASLVARAVEIAEDAWAEARSVRDASRPGR
jgi:hypothetical protein